MLSTVQPRTRVLAPSTRGYSPSPVFPPSGVEEGSKQRDRDLLGHDLASMITALITKLSLLSQESSTIKLAAWSMGNCSLLSTYNLLSSGSMSAANSETLKTKISSINSFSERYVAIAILLVLWMNQGFPKIYLLIREYAQTARSELLKVVGTLMQPHMATCRV